MKRPRSGTGVRQVAVTRLVQDSRVTTDMAGSPGAEPQAVLSPLTGAAIFLVVVVKPGSDHADTVRGLCGDLAGLIRAVGFRGTEDYLTCVAGLSATAWDRLGGGTRPAGLHPFVEFRSEGRVAPATPGDLLFHIRAARMDLCFELATQIMARLSDAVTVADEVHGFRYFEHRDLLGFVDGTENPAGRLAYDSVIIGDEDPAFAGGSYVLVQKYLHDMDAWNALTTEQQENVIGRSKLADIEQDDSVKLTSAHSALTTITENGREIKIVRDNMPFGHVGTDEYGTYFIGYSCSPATIELMLQNMFIGRPPGNYDRILDVSTAVTGGLFFVPPAPLLEGLADDGDDAAADDASPDTPSVAAPGRDGSLNIGSLRGASHDE
jgi:porphyrinogen peroxidase